MTVVIFLSPDKRHIKASSDIHLSFFIALSDFFLRKTLFLWLQAHRTKQPQQFSYHDPYPKVLRWVESRT